MRILFFDPEQYLSFENEPSNYELRLPILNCGVVTSHRDYVYQRVLRSEGRKAMNRRALKEVLEFKPDLVVYSTSWPDQSIAPSILQEIMRHGIPVYTQVWDTHIEPQPHELEWFRNCSYFGVWDSVANYLHYCSLAEGQSGVRGVIFAAGNNVFTDIIYKKDLVKLYDVTLLGSNEGQRVQLVQYLGDKLASYGISLHKFGGLVDSSKGTPDQGLTDQWVTWEKYVAIINQSKICLSSQTVSNRMQIKGKVLHYLACGTLCLSDSNAELRKIVPDGCLVYYDDFKDCLNKIIYYISNEVERRRIANAGYNWFCSAFNYKSFWSKFLRAAIKGDVTLPDVKFE